MSTLALHSTSAQTALGKFYLHPWDSQVLVDWAKSLTQQGFTEGSLLELSRMDGESRDSILDQFDTVTILNNLDVNFREIIAITAYLNDLRERVLDDRIEARAALAQVRPLAYDLDGIQLLGLSELDEDLNLIDSGEKAFNHTGLTADNADVHIRTFFREMVIMDPLPDPAEEFALPEEPEDSFSAEDRLLMHQLESLALSVLIVLLLLYLFLVLSGFQ